jgi:hypothetical protein
MPVSVNFSFTFSNATVRDSALLDYAKIHGLDIYSDSIINPVTGEVLTLGSSVQQSKVVPAIEKHLFNLAKSDIVNYRAGLAAKTAHGNAKAAASSELNAT